ncbi:MAG: LPS export ABC transporter permease LptG [Thermodesulfobacteriota bacterium]
MRAQPLLRPRLLESYIAREFLKLLSLSLAAFLSIYLVVDFFEKIDRLVRAGLGLEALGTYIFLKIPFALGQVLPPAVLLGAMLIFGLLSRTHETLAMRTSGLDILRLTRPVLVIAGLAVLVLLSLNLYLIPWTQGWSNLFWETRVQKKPPRGLINLEHFWYKGDQAIFNILLFRKDIQTLEGVKIYLFNGNFQLRQIIAAKRAKWEGDHWRFFDGFVQNFAPEGGESGESFAERDFSLTERPEDFGALEKKVPEMDQSELSRYVRRLERDGYKSTPYRVELQSRISLALTPLILAILGLGLALRQERTYIPAMVAVGLGLMFGYWLLVGFCASLGQAGRWPILWAIWMPHGAFGLLAASLLRRVSR